MRPESAARVWDASEVRVPELDRIVGMRNVIAHEYGEVDDEIVWAAATKRIPG
ncbi:HepT-like ribonuclease domain-containing protein [Arthrobacter sp.]|uniref:HepT-like ribonuclease domain-containing protein n=1 Tax=Arthrobacter sp. TaxID=1667 RepID=UPI00338E94C9